MRAILDYCSGGIARNVPAGTSFIHEGDTTGHLFVLIEGKLEVIKGDSVVAVSPSRAPWSARCRCCWISRIPRRCARRPIRPSTNSTMPRRSCATSRQVALLIARLLAQRLNVATTYLADIKHQYAGHGNHLAMVGEVLQSMINLPPSQVSPGSDRQSDPRI